MIDTPINRVIGRLTEHDRDPKRINGNGQWEALCPAHEDNDPSLGFKEGDDGTVLDQMPGRLHRGQHCQSSRFGDEGPVPAQAGDEEINGRVDGR